MTVRKGDWIQTFTGRQYWPLDPRPEDVDVQDIAHHLSNLCRFTGACKRFYSVAEHSVHVSYLVPVEFALYGLLHDAAEAYCNDIARPVKRSIEGYAEIEALNETAIWEALGCIHPDLHLSVRPLLKQADNAILVAEQAALMAPCAHRWRPESIPEDLQRRAHEQLGGILAGWQPERAKWQFLMRYAELTQ